MKYNPQIHHRRSIRLKGYDYSQAGAYFVTIATQGMACFFGEVRDGEMRLNPPGQMVERWWVELAHKFPTVGLGEYVIMPNHFHGVIVIHSENEGAYAIPGAVQGAHAGAPVRNEAGGVVGVDLCVDPEARVDPEAHLDPGAEQGAEQGAHAGAPVRNEARGIVGADLRVGPEVRVDPEAHFDPGEERGAHIGAPVRMSIPTIVQWFKTMTTNEYIRGVKQLGWEPFAGRLWLRNYYEHIIRNEADLRRIEEYIQNNPRRWAEDQLHPQAAPNKFNQDR